jgi:hypothetical protein
LQHHCAEFAAESAPALPASEGWASSAEVVAAIEARRAGAHASSTAGVARSDASREARDRLRAREERPRKSSKLALSKVDRLALTPPEAVTEAQRAAYERSLKARALLMRSAAGSAVKGIRPSELVLLQVIIDRSCLAPSNPEGVADATPEKVVTVAVSSSQNLGALVDAAAKLGDVRNTNSMNVREEELRVVACTPEGDLSGTDAIDWRMPLEQALKEGLVHNHGRLLLVRGPIVKS